LPSRPSRPGRWCALAAPFHPCLWWVLLRRRHPSAVSSLWHFPAGRPDWPLASTLPCGVPTFLDQVKRLAATTRPTHRHYQYGVCSRSLDRVTGSPVGNVVAGAIPPVDPHPHDAIGRGSRKTSAVRSQPGSGAIDSPWRRSGRLTMSRMAIATTMMTTAITAVPRPPRSRRRRSRSGSDRPLRSQSAFR